MNILKQVVFNDQIIKEYQAKMQEYSKQLEVELNEKYKQDIDNNYVYKLAGITLSCKTKMKLGGNENV